LRAAHERSEMAMLVMYDSKTGNVQRFIGKLPIRAVRIEEDLTVDEPFVLVTYTTGFGQAPAKTASFLSRNARQLRGVAASGNRNWGTSFAGSADRIAEQYCVPVVGKFELSGTARDVEHFLKGVQSLASY